MMFDNIEAFSVGTKKYTIEGLEPFKDETANEFIGLSRSVYPPRTINGFKVSFPEENDILALRLYSEEDFPSARKMIIALKEKGLWGKEDGNLPNEKMRFQRQFIDNWMDSGLIEREGRGKYSLTPHGRFSIDTYYVDI